MSHTPTPFVIANCTTAVVGSVMAHQPGEGSVEKGTSTHAFQSPRRYGGFHPL